MAQFKVFVSYNVSRSKYSPDSYRLYMTETSEPETDKLVSSGPTVNDIAESVGVFASVRKAAEAIMQFVDCQCQIVHLCEPHTTHGYALIAWRKLGPYERPIANKTTAGVWLAT